MSSLTPEQVPYTGPYSLATGKYRSKGPTAEALKRACSRMGAPSLPWRAFDQHFNQALEDALDWIDKTHFNLSGNNGYAEGRWERVRTLKIPAELAHAGEWALDQTAINMIKNEASKPKTPIPQLGPVVSGCKSVLNQDLTHATDGLAGYPAFDDNNNWGHGGGTVLAPEDLEVTKLGGSQGGAAIYAKGTTCDWWFGHLDPASRPSVGKKIAKGQKIGTISGELDTPHCHAGINTQRLLGHELKHHTNYTHGAPTVGTQFEEELA